VATRYNFRSTALASGVHVAATEQQLDTGTGTVATNSVAEGAGSAGLHSLWTSAADVPNLAAWPSGTYSGQLNVSTAGANITYGFSVVDATFGIGHIGAVDSGLTADQRTVVQSEAAFTGTGLKSFSASWSPAAGSATDRLECLLAVKNSGTMSQTLAVSINDGTSYLDFPDAAAAPSPTGPPLNVMSRLYVPWRAAY
jgi:hypothetical protein